MVFEGFALWVAWIPPTSRVLLLAGAGTALMGRRAVTKIRP